MNRLLEVEHTFRFPGFFKVYSESMNPESLQIPPKFVRQLKGFVPKKPILKNSQGRCWEVHTERMGKEFFFTNGWSKFASDLLLADGHVLVFDYDGKLTFDFMHLEHSRSEQLKSSLSVKPSRKNVGDEDDDDYEDDEEESNEDVDEVEPEEEEEDEEEEYDYENDDEEEEEEYEYVEGDETEKEEEDEEEEYEDVTKFELVKEENEYEYEYEYEYEDEDEEEEDSEDDYVNDPDYDIEADVEEEQKNKMSKKLEKTRSRKKRRTTSLASRSGRDQRRQY